MKYYLAVDIGASSGRLILGHLKNGRMQLQEIHRFENGMVMKNGHLVWNVDGLFSEILTGMKKCKEAGKLPVSIGIDTWAVDYVFLDEKGERLGEAYGYRDHRTSGIEEKVYEIINEKSLYARTGIQRQPFNTIYQLMAVKEQEPEILEQVAAMLMIPDYLNYLLCGVKACEYTNATTTQLLNPETKTWDMELIESLGIKKSIFPEVRPTGTELGSLREEIANQVGFDCKVVLPATHDTGSAVMAVPANKDDVLYISSGTWSLMGTEIKEAICTEESRMCNFTNEGGYDYRFRFLKNIMGMWMINSVKKELDVKESFAAICENAAKEKISSIVDANSERFLAPASMVEAVQDACKESGQQVPEGIYQLAAVIYNSLAKCYGDTAREIEKITGVSYDSVHIIGGGANAGYLNLLTAKACKKKVLAGPVEATAVGNLAAQMIAAGELENLQDARACIYKSFEIVEYDA